MLRALVLGASAAGALAPASFAGPGEPPSAVASGPEEPHAPAPAAPLQAEPGAPETDEDSEPPAPPPTAGRPYIPWQTWSPRTLQVARDLDRPILLFLTNPWNTLGAVMDANTFTDPRVVGTARELFVPVRVDIDRRPDIEERFGTPGLPGVAIVMPSGESLYLKTPRGNYVRAAGAYYTADEMYHYLRSIADYYRENRALLDLKIEDIVDRFKKQENASSAPLDGGVLQAVAAALRESFDRTHGGFGSAPKVPEAQSLLLCWHLARARSDAEALDMGLRTLRALWESPLHDKVDGGVFRLAMERDWSGPRYEKVLEVNARLLEAMAEGALASGERWLAQAVREQADFLLGRFAHPEGGFARAQGPGDLSGSYFQLGRRERRRSAPPAFELTRIVSWNAHAVSGLLRAYQALGEERYRERALETIEYLLSRCRSGQRGMLHYYDARTRASGLLVDQVAMTRALLDAHQVTGHARYLQVALELVSVVRTFFRDQESPRFVDRVPEPLAVGAMTRPDRDLVENSELALLLLDLSVLTGTPVYAEEARQILETFADEVGLYKAYAAPLARAVDRALRSPLRLVVAPRGQQERARALARAAAGLPHPWVLVDWIDGAGARKPLEGEQALLSEPGPSGFLAAGGRRSAILRTPEQVRSEGRNWPAEAIPLPAGRPEPVREAPAGQDPAPGSGEPAPGGAPGPG